MVSCKCMLDKPAHTGYQGIPLHIAKNPCPNLSTLAGCMGIIHKPDSCTIWNDIMVTFYTISLPHDTRVCTIACHLPQYYSHTDFDLIYIQQKVRSTGASALVTGFRSKLTWPQANSFTKFNSYVAVQLYTQPAASVLTKIDCQV